MNRFLAASSKEQSLSHDHISGVSSVQDNSQYFRDFITTSFECRTYFVYHDRDCTV